MQALEMPDGRRAIAAESEDNWTEEENGEGEGVDAAAAAEHDRPRKRPAAEVNLENKSLYPGEP